MQREKNNDVKYLKKAKLNLINQLESKIKNKIIFFATKNIIKFKEAKKVLANYKIEVAMLRVESLEIQNDNIEKIAKKKILKVVKNINLPLIVEDAGLFIEKLNGFPGPYSSYVFRTIGNKGIIKLMKNIKKRKAEFRSAIAYFSENLNEPKMFKGKVIGEITTEERREMEKGFGFDPIFIPKSINKTFGEMSSLEKNRYSHRAKALKEFAEWFKSQSTIKIKK